MNIPNKISIVRLCMTVVMVVVFLLGVYDIIPYGELYATAVYILASITDGIDGRIARKYGLITTLGKFLDSIADKILCLAAFILIARNAPDVAYAPSVWVVVLVIVHVARDFMISALRQVCASENIIMAADKLGKRAAVFIYLRYEGCVCFYFIGALRTLTKIVREVRKEGLIKHTSENSAHTKLVIEPT